MPNTKTRVIDVTPGLKEAVDVLTAPNLVNYLPNQQKPIEIHSNSDPAFTGVTDYGLLTVENDPYSVSVSWDSADKGSHNALLPSVSVRGAAFVEVSSSFKGTAKELVILSKELSQIADFIKYAKLYKKAREEKGEKYSLFYYPWDSQKRPISDDEFAVMVAMGESAKEQSYGPQGKKLDTRFNNLIDLGSHIRLIPLYLNWIGYYENEWPKDQDSDPFTSVGNRIAGILLNNEKLIEVRNRICVWKSGKPPEIDSPEFLALIRKHTSLPI